MFERNPGKIALRTEWQYTSAIEYGLMAAFIAAALVTGIGMVTPRLQTALGTVAAPMSVLR